MAISFPLNLPTVTGFRSRQFEPNTVVGMVASQFTGEQQIFASVGQWLVFRVQLPAMSEANARIWMAFFMSLNGMEGTFLMGDSVRRTSLGTIAGTVTVGASAVANSTTLPISGGTGAFAVGDWLQVFTGSSSRLHCAMQVNAGSVDVFPRLRSAYANGSAIAYTNPKGVFRIAEIPAESMDEAKICQGIEFIALEAL